MVERAQFEVVECSERFEANEAGILGAVVELNQADGFLEGCCEVALGEVGVGLHHEQVEGEQGRTFRSADVLVLPALFYASRELRLAVEIASLIVKKLELLLLR